MTAMKLKQQAAEVIEMKLGYKPTPSDLELVDAETHEIDGGQERVISIDFYRKGFPDVRYIAAFRYAEWKLVIINARTENELLLD